MEVSVPDAVAGLVDLAKDVSSNIVVLEDLPTGRSLGFSVHLRAGGSFGALRGECAAGWPKEWHVTKDGDERARAAVGSLILPRYRDLRSFLRDVCGIEDDRGGGRTRGRGARFDEASALPPPPPELLDRFEAYYELRLPELYRRLLGSFHGADIIDARSRPAEPPGPSGRSCSCSMTRPSSRWRVGRGGRHVDVLRAPQGPGRMSAWSGVRCRI